MGWITVGGKRSRTQAARIIAVSQKTAALRPAEAKQRHTCTTPATAADPVALADKAPLRHHPHDHAGPRH